MNALLRDRFPLPMSSRCRSVTWVASFLLAAMLSWPPPCAAQDFLDPEAAFRFSARMVDARTAEVAYAIADGYYMYRERFGFRAEGATLGAPVLPAGEVKFDDTFGKNVETYRHSVRILLPVRAHAPFVLTATAQGCADRGLCYPPMESRISLHPEAAAGSPPRSADLAAQEPAAPGPAAADAGASAFEAAIGDGRLLFALPLFFLAGIALAFTPCVLPMLPILSSILVGEGGTVTRRRGFALAAAYSAGMAIIYTAMGMVAGWMGEGLAASFQSPWMLAVFALLIVALALAMFDVYQLQIPAAIQTKLTQASARQTAGKLAGVFAMGALSGLIIGPCVAPPLIGALVFISKTRDAALGGAALFAIAAGMSVPLLLVGVSAGWLLPRAGPWMEAVKRFFGVLLLGVALWMVSPVIPAGAQMLGWFALFTGYGSYLLLDGRWGAKQEFAGALFVLAGLAELTGVAAGSRDALAPLAVLRAQPEKPVEFVRVQSSAQLDTLLADAAGRPAMLDFYADWCVSCKEMEKLTFTDAQVRKQLAGMVLLQADVTANNADARALLRRFRLYGPPGIIFFDGNGREVESGRVVGFQNADEFRASLARISYRRDATR